MLHGKLQIREIRDVEAFTAKLLPPNLNPTDREDLHAYLIATTWELSLTYRPGGITFSTYAGTTLRQRAYDWQRTRNGRTRWTFHEYDRPTGRNPKPYERHLPEILSTDQHPRTLESTPRHPPTDRDPTLDRLLRTRGSDEAWRHHTRHPRMPRRAA